MLRTIVIAGALLPGLALAQPPASDRPADPEERDQTPSQGDEYDASPGQEAHLGVVVMGLTPELRTFFGAPSDSGLLVARVTSNSPGSRAGLRVGDIITRFGSTKLDSAEDVISALAHVQGAQKVPVMIVRDHARITLRAAFAPQPEARPPDNGSET